MQPLEIRQMREEIAVRDVLLEALRQEAIEASQTLKTATQVMPIATGNSFIICVGFIVILCRQGNFLPFYFLAWTMCGAIVIGTCKNLLTIMVRYVTKAMIAAKSKITSLQEQLDTTTGFLQQEKEATQRALDLFSSSLLVRSWKR
jgi:hypothetical protein